MEGKALQKPPKWKELVLNWIGFRWTDIEQWATWYGRTSQTGEHVTVERAMTLSAVYACTRLISQTISTLPIGLYEWTTIDGRRGRKEVFDHPLARIIGFKPNADMTSVVFWEAVVASILLQRGAYLEKHKIAKRLVAVDFIHPLRIARREDKWAITDKDGRVREVPLDKVVYIPAFTQDGICGKSVIEYGCEVIGSALSANKAANKTFKNGLSQTVAFKYPKVLQPNQRDQMRGTIKALSGAANAGEPVILEADMDAMTIGINPHDAQLLESRGHGSDEVCSMFGVHPVMIGRGDKASSWASSSESLNRWFLQYALRPWMKRIEMGIWDGLLEESEKPRLYAEFAVEGLLRADTTGRANHYSTGLQNGWMSRNEVRAMENLPPIEGGDVITVQSNLVPLDQLGQPDPIDEALVNELAGAE